MCGIIGVVARNSKSTVDHALFARLVGSLAHRGPDAEGIVHRSHFSFGHRRLSIVDLSSSSNQPMQDIDGSLFITYNGEIYNYRSIRDELSALGCVFRTNSDTEVILYSYRVWGERFVERLNGIFAFGLYDEEKNEFLLYRDRIGVKPVYYHVAVDAVYFASELKGVIGHSQVPRRINPHAVNSFLTYRQVLGTQTYFENVLSLEPGTFLQVRGGHYEVKRYWQLDTDRGRSTYASAESVGQLISESVQLQAIADVPIAALLSGGLDSSILVYELSRLRGANMHCFTGRFAEEAYNEAPYAQDIANHCGMHWHAVDLSADGQLEFIRQLIRLKDQPLGMHNEVAMHVLAKEVKQYASVVICGEGADELFGGYGRIFRAPFDYRRLRLMTLLPQQVRRRISSITGLCPDEARVGELEFFLKRYSYFPADDRQALYQPEFAREVGRDIYTHELIAGFFSEHFHLSFFDRIWLFFMRYHLPGLLEMLDAATMSVGLEARVPFTDHRLVQQAFNLPLRAKLRWRSPIALLRSLMQPVEMFSERHDINKVVLRDLYADQLPPMVLHRKKMGFPVPLGKWLGKNHRTEVNQLLFSPDARLNEFIKPEALQAWFKRYEKPANDQFGRQLWLLCNLEIFLQEYF
ncbi:asparagine synthase (glutamine-hydrolyzing) [Chitiniphilus purpureus]|uniref:asparagine synthase (glutamine-hydrolyzing) n=1 Tax=Chitiniphilus purpureus TaxID=2981137 RepID=A0ABY6DN42_9NEIS|nr:asparagine synthase (glutamine-hydrolyzing) [Chitiniphilus sp. CD1]UXY15804.1 asparagine synthase (glutamine-hydrolyzing) [Chitiniphilus sp. CD1]